MTLQTWTESPLQVSSSSSSAAAAAAAAYFRRHKSPTFEKWQVRNRTNSRTAGKIRVFLYRFSLTEGFEDREIPKKIYDS